MHTFADCAAVAFFSLLVSSTKSFRIAGADLLSPSFDFAADLAAFDIEATMRYVEVEQFGAASLAIGWIVGGICSGAWRMERTVGTMEANCFTCSASELAPGARDKRPSS